MLLFCLPCLCFLCFYVCLFLWALLPELNFMDGRHRRTSQWAGGYSPPDSGKTNIFFRAKAKFFGQKPAAKNEKRNIFEFIKGKNTELIPSGEINCPQSGIFY